MLHDPVVEEQADHRHSTDPLMERMAIHELVQNWVLWRDAGDWERFATVWHDDGRMNATWFQASAADFIDGCRKGFDKGIIGLHTLGGITVEVQGIRAVAQSKMQIIQRGDVDGIEVDVTCFGRFVDALEKRDGRWGIVQRQPIYELDRMTAVNPAEIPQLDKELLSSFPVGYRHLAYLQTKVGFAVYNNLPGTRGPEIDALTARMKEWLRGAESDCLNS